MTYITKQLEVSRIYHANEGWEILSKKLLVEVECPNPQSNWVLKYESLHKRHEKTKASHVEKLAELKRNLKKSDHELQILRRIIDHDIKIRISNLPEDN